MRYRFSGISILLVGVVLFLSQLFFHRWDRGSIIYGGDAWGYYSYLPATFIHHDLDNLKKSLTARYHEDYNRTLDTTQPLTGEFTYPDNGNKLVIKYTYGVALLQTPFFFIAHSLAKPLGFDANGYTLVYVILMHVSLLFYLLLGLYFVRALLLKYYSDYITASVLIILALGTNLYYFVADSTPMAHVYLFCLFAILLYSAQKFYEARNWKYAISIGLCCGLITLIRPNEIVCVAIPLSFGVLSISQLRDRLNVVKQEWLKLAVAGLLFAMPVLVLLFYWKTMSGSWIYSTYPNENFDFKHPHIFEGLFSFKNGWLSYTPIMLLAIAGLPLAFLRTKEWVLPFLIFIPQHIYIIYSWWSWNYINGFGSRPMIETYPLWSIPLGAFLVFISRKRIGQWAITAIVLFFISVNVFQTWQVSNNLLVSDYANKVFVWHSLFKSELTARDLVEYDCSIAQPSGLAKKRELVRYGFEDSTNSNFVRLAGKEGFVYKITGDPQFVDNGKCRFSADQFKKGDWIKASVWCKPLQTCDLFGCTSLVVSFNRGEKNLQYSIMRLQNKVLKHKTLNPYTMEDEEGIVSFFVPVPKGLKPGDEVNFFMHTTSNKVLVDDLLIEVWN